MDAQLSRFCQTLTEWRTLGEPPVLCYALDHQYTDAALKLASLKGDDYFRARYVIDACAKADGFFVLLAELKKVTTLDHSEFDEDPRSELQLDRVVDLTGSMLVAGQVIDEEYLVQDLYSGRGPDIQQGGEYLGNQHVEIDRIYNDTVSA